MAPYINIIILFYIIIQKLNMKFQDGKLSLKCSLKYIIIFDINVTFGNKQKIFLHNLNITSKVT